MKVQCLIKMTFHISKEDMYNSINMLGICEHFRKRLNFFCIYYNKINLLLIKYFNNEKNKTIKLLGKNTGRLIHKLEARSTFKTEYKPQNPKRKRQIKLTPNKCKAYFIDNSKNKRQIGRVFAAYMTNKWLSLHSQ